MAKSKTQRGVKETHQGGGTRTLCVSDGHVINEWIPPTSYCGVKVEGYVSFTPGYMNDQWPGPIECEECLEAVK